MSLQKVENATSCKLNNWSFLYARAQLLVCFNIPLHGNSGGWSKHFRSRLLTLSRESVELPKSVSLIVCGPSSSHIALQILF